ncbi:hypothetical protein SAMN00790413_05462 [Deinococcus hopiensis KR-140]|uniref:Uncharacterized protein n=1 Tax=Deinococcus hopiensis KR-140 TaxID=695939 RepID=A0A1W1UGU7_9DEIO|nr:hypothetical protein SAMN00790413_05462 [Deinococcus hopiensis KR-140]
MLEEAGVPPEELPKGLRGGCRTGVVLVQNRKLGAGARGGPGLPACAAGGGGGGDFRTSSPFWRYRPAGVADLGDVYAKLMFIQKARNVRATSRKAARSTGLTT